MSVMFILFSSSSSALPLAVGTKSKVFSCPTCYSQSRRVHRNITETADEIFYEAEALNVDEKDPETKEELYGSYDQKTMNAETQAPESRVKAQNAETQTTEFEYLCKQAVLQHDADRLLSTCQSFRNTFL